MSWHSLPLFVRLAGRPVILLGEGEAADAKRRLLDRAGALVSGEDAPAALAIVAIEHESDALAAVERLKARGILVNAVDRPDWCDFTVPAIVDRDPVLVAIGTGGASAGLAAALRQRLEGLLPAGLGEMAKALASGRGALRSRYPDGGDRRRALGAAFAQNGALDPFRGSSEAAAVWLASDDPPPQAQLMAIRLTSPDPEELTLRQARALALADRVFYRANVPTLVLDRARADAVRIMCDAQPAEPGAGLSVDLSLDPSLAG